VVDKLSGIFKDANADNIFVREPIVNYLRACPRPEAADALAEAARIDPEAVRRAATLAGLAGLAMQTPPTPTEATVTPPGPVAAATTSTAAPPIVTEPPPATDEPNGAVPMASRVPPVFADEDGSGDPPIQGSGRDAPGRPASLPPTGPATWKWIVWAAAVLVVAVIARLFLRPRGGIGTAAR